MSTLLLQPVWNRLVPQCEDVVRKLERDHGWRLMRVFGSLGVDRVRSHLASRAMRTEYEWWAWLDADSLPTVEAMLHLRRVAEERACDWLACAVVCRGSGDLNVRTMDSGQIPFGAAGGVYELTKGAVAVAVTNRRLFERIAPELPEVDYHDEGTGELFEGRPYFLPIVRDRTHYGEDYSLALRAREAGCRIWCDTRVRVDHLGEIPLGWEYAKKVRK